MVVELVMVIMVLMVAKTHVILLEVAMEMTF